MLHVALVKTIGQTIMKPLRLLLEFSFSFTSYITFYVSFLLKLRRSNFLMMSSKKDREIWKDKCINPFQKKKHKGTTLRRVSDNLRVRFPNVRKDSQI